MLSDDEFESHRAHPFVYSRTQAFDLGLARQFACPCCRGAFDREVVSRHSPGHVWAFSPADPAEQFFYGSEIARANGFRYPDTFAAAVHRNLIPVELRQRAVAVVAHAAMYSGIMQPRNNGDLWLQRPLGGDGDGTVVDEGVRLSSPALFQLPSRVDERFVGAGVNIRRESFMSDLNGRPAGNGDFVFCQLLESPGRAAVVASSPETRAAFTVEVSVLLDSGFPARRRVPGP